MSACGLSKELPPYQYRSLKRDEVRFMILQPGRSKDELCFSLDHELLVQPSNTEKKTRLSLQELRRTLKSDWDVFETLEGQYFFYQNDRLAGTPQHPDQSVDSDLYAASPEYPNSCFEPSYEALSYVWGSLKLTVTAYVVHEDTSTTTLQIGQNLATALRHLRYSDRPRVLWVDAICINQKDPSERSEQVLRMGLIYGLASRVIVWFGVERDNSRHAISTLQYLGEQVDVSTDGWLLPSATAVEPEWHHKECAIPFPKKTWRAIAAIFRNPWWFRIWTLQEILLANKNAILQYGQHQMLFSTLQKAIACLINKKGVPWEVRNALFDNGGDLPPAGGIPLTKLLDICTVRRCTDPKDKIYGLLSICPHGFASKIRPQYLQSVSQVYKDAFLAQVESSNRLDVLSYSGRTENVFNLPSWIPNWDATEKLTLSVDRHRSAAGLSKAQWQLIEPQALEAVGIRCGEVWDHTEPLPFKKPGFIDVLSKWRPRTLRGTGEISGISFWEALRMDYFKDNYPGTRSFPTREEWISSCSHDIRQALHTLPDEHLAALHGSSGFSTKEGFMGFGPSPIQRGKLQAVLTGIDTVTQPCLFARAKNAQVTLFTSS